jgi:cell wall-associated NlpC family hydrolase
MQSKLSRREAIRVISAWGMAPLALGSAPLLARQVENHDDQREQESGAPHRYQLHYSYSEEQLIGDLLHGERGNPERQSDIPHRDWYTHETRRKFGAWGPEQRIYEPLAEMTDRPETWLRERVIATAARFIGYEYQHHHIPDWNPPQTWPWKPCCAGRNGRGVDCSNFTGFVYNQGFGIKMSTGIERQSELHSALERHEHPLEVRKIHLPENYRERAEVLRTGDLVYICGREGGPVTHVVIWVGEIGVAPSHTPLIMDSHGGNVDDDWGEKIPCGIHLRPFREDSWYNRCASHAHRIFG